MLRYDITLVDLTSILFLLCTNVKLIYIIFHRGWSLASIFTLIKGINNNVNQVEDSAIIKDNI